MDYLKELENCGLCEWRCRVDRLSGELGICGVGIPQVASSCLHPAPPASYDAFMIGCNFRCLGCQNWFIANYPANPSYPIEGYYDPAEWARMALRELSSPEALAIGADRLFFTGGEPTCSLPWCEKVVEEARKLDPSTKVNFDTNGFMTRRSLERVLSFTTSITYDLKAYSEDLHEALTGAPVEPVLRNLEIIVRRAKEKIWEVRVLLIPEIHDDEEIRAICEFLASLDPTIPVCFLAFRPNFVLDSHPGASSPLMRRAVEIAKKSGLERASWSGLPGIPGRIPERVKELAERIESDKLGARLALAYARLAGCIASRRVCGTCENKLSCELRLYKPKRRT